MSERASWCLPPELTGTVFSHLLWTPPVERLGGDYDSVCSAMRVCKEWKVPIIKHSTHDSESDVTIQSIGETVLFENVALSKADAVRALRIRLWESAYIQKTFVGHLVAGLELQGLKESNRRKQMMPAQEANDTILAILMLVPNLRRVTFRGWATGQTDLLVLMRAEGTSLTKLDLHVEAEHDGVFPVLNAFPHLNTLCLILGFGLWKHSHSHPLFTEV
jgi:hypothetical protein